MPNSRTKKGAAVISLIIAECVIVSWVLVTYIGYHTPIAFVVNAVLAAVVFFEITLVDGGLRRHEPERVQPFVDS